MNCCCKTTDCRCADTVSQEQTQGKMEWLEEQNELLKKMYIQLMEAYHDRPEKITPATQVN